VDGSIAEPTIFHGATIGVSMRKLAWPWTSGVCSSANSLRLREPQPETYSFAYLQATGEIAATDLRKGKMSWIGTISGWSLQ
jgi:hypothetical protein